MTKEANKLLPIEPFSVVVELSFAAVNAAPSASGRHRARKGFAEIVEVKGIDEDSVSAFYMNGGNGPFYTMVDFSAVKPPKGTKGKLQPKPAAKPAETAQASDLASQIADQVAAAVAAALAAKKS